MERSLSSGYQDVDGSSDLTGLETFLHAMRSESFVLEAKHESFALCELLPGGSVLDVGCGTGEDLVELAALVGPDGIATGVDRSARFIDAAQRSSVADAAGARFIQADAVPLPFPDASFDACRADRVVQHLDTADEAVAEMVRVIRPGGVVVISEVISRLDVEDPDPEITEAIFAQRWTEQERRGWIAPLLPLIMGRAGLAGMRVIRRSAVQSDYAAIKSVLDLDRLCEAARQEGTVRASDIARWTSTLKDRLESGAGALHWEFFHVAGRKPAEQAPDRAT